jgi:hypothetical protein
MDEKKYDHHLKRCVASRVFVVVNMNILIGGYLDCVVVASHKFGGWLGA